MRVIDLKIQPYFEGWYFKHVTKEGTISFIPGMQVDRFGQTCAFIQVITENNSYYVAYPIEEYYADRRNFEVRVGNNRFSKKGISIHIDTEELKVEGKIFYGVFSTIRYSIMGPVGLIPNLHCNHEIISMKHKIKGWLLLNQKSMEIKQGFGYIEGDYGYTFPKSYFWTQCNLFQKKNLSIFASGADIVVLGKKIRGCIAVIHVNKREYRFATYLGARVLRMDSKCLIIKQGSWLLRVVVRQENGKSLRAPINGQMAAYIKECVSVPTRYQLYYKKQLVLEAKSKKASHEYVKELLFC